MEYVVRQGSAGWVQTYWHEPSGHWDIVFTYDPARFTCEEDWDAPVLPVRVTFEPRPPHTTMEDIWL